MGLKIPDLDDREYAEILEDARERIPIHAEEWTDHNVHDPGITILETLAWIAESYSYQLDQVTDAHRRKYLQLMGVHPEPPKPATASLRVQIPEDTAGTTMPGAGLEEMAGTTIPSGEALVAEVASGGEEFFRTTSPVTLTRASIQRVISEHRGGRTDNTNANDTTGLHFLGFGEDAQEGSAMYLGFDRDPLEGVDTLDVTLSFHGTDLPEPVSHGDEPIEFEPSVTVSWQYCTDYSEWYLDRSWSEFVVRDDGTNRLYRGGTVRLERPGDWSGATATKDDEVLGQDDGLVWIRCRIGRPERGGSGHEVPPQFDAVAVNALQVHHGVRVAEQELQRPDGGDRTSALPGQTFEFEHGPVLEEPDGEEGHDDRPADDDSTDADRANGREGAPALVVGPGDRHRVLDVRWREVEDFDASSPDDRHFVLDRAEGTVRFGDEIRGTIPEPGQRVLAESYLHGGGTRGNVPGSASWRFRRREVEKEGTYTYYSGPRGSPVMRGAVVVGEPDEGNVGDWFEDANGDVELVDRRGASEVTVEVGVEGEDGPAFSPAAVRIDPGTVVRFAWVSDGHSVVVESQPTDGGWRGHPAPEPTGYEFAHRFEPSLDLSRVRVHSQGDATGGRDAESIDEALDRLKADMQVPYRAVTLADYETIAKSTPGLRFGRARAFVAAGDDPPDCDRRPAVSVIVVPFSTRDRPLPSRGFLEAVGSHLKRHRLLTDRVDVAPPTYVGIGVNVELRIVSGYSSTERTAAVDTRLREFLHPLDGFDGEGWPFGRPVYQSELYEVIEGIEGIDCVLDVTITAFGSNARYRDGNVEIDPSTLVYSEDHSVVVRSGRGDCGVGS